MHPGAAGCTGCIIGGAGQRCPVGTAAATDAPGLRIIGHVTRLTWQPAALVAPDASRAPETDVPAVASRPSATRHADAPPCCGRGRDASQSPDGARSWPGPATRPGRPIPVITHPGSSLQASRSGQGIQQGWNIALYQFGRRGAAADVQEAASHADPRTTMRQSGHAPAWTGMRPTSSPLSSPEQPDSLSPTICLAAFGGQADLSLVAHLQRPPNRYFNRNREPPFGAAIALRVTIGSGTPSGLICVQVRTS